MIRLDSIYFPKKEYLMDVIGNFRTTTCLDIKSEDNEQVSLALTESKDDLYNLHKCEILGPINIYSMNNGYAYNFILFIPSSKKTNILIFPRTEQEIGSSHKCYINDIPDESIVLCSGEIMLYDYKIYYNTTSSLWFRYIWPYLYFNLMDKMTGGSRVNVYDKDKLKLQKEIKECIKDNIEQINISNLLKEVFKGADVQFVDYSKWMDFVIIKDLTNTLEYDNASCQRVFRSKQDCETARNRPDTGLDCDNDGISLQEFINKGKLKSEIPIFEPPAIYLEDVIDDEKLKNFFKIYKEYKPKGAFTRSKYLKAYNKLISIDDNIEKIPKLRIKIWPNNNDIND